MLREVTGVLPERIAIVTGSGEILKFATEDYFYYYNELKNAFLSQQEAFDATTIPEPSGFGSYGNWESYAKSWLEDNDHLSLVANIRASQVQKLRTAGIETTTELANSAIERVKGIGAEVLPRLKQQARLQLLSRGKEIPDIETLPMPQGARHLGLAQLPPSSSSDIFFDMEGFPLEDGGLEYLFGATYWNKGQVQFNDWWAVDKNREQEAFEEFVDWAFNRWVNDPSLHIYHYGDYEVSALRRLMGEYASREQQIDALLRGQVFVDLYRIVRQGLCIGTPSYSLKQVERLYRPSREGDVGTAEESMVVFDRWIESGESSNWNESPILQGIREYNEDDCISTLELAKYLRSIQKQLGISWISTDVETDDTNPASPQFDCERLALKLREQLPAPGTTLSDDQQITQLLSWILEYHRREAKPGYWKWFHRQVLTSEDLFDDNECLAQLIRTETPRYPIVKSYGYEYTFDATQESKVKEGRRYHSAQDVTLSVKLLSLDSKSGTAILTRGTRAEEPPNEIDLIPEKPRGTVPMVNSIIRTSTMWHDEKLIQKALREFLFRCEPDISGREIGESVVREGESLVGAVSRVVSEMNSTLLCIQGPPGAGKTFCAARAILNLIRNGKRVGVSSNSHAAISNLLKEVAAAAREAKQVFSAVKIGPPEGLDQDPFFNIVRQASDWTPGVTGPELLAGGTAYAFSHEDWVDKFDYLFIDEAGQVPLANLIAMSPSTENLVIVGDQMQLEQPRQGFHPGTSGLSVMAYFMGDRPTIPPNNGVFLDTTWRLHPGICTFISDAVYEGRLDNEPHTKNRVIEIEDSSLKYAKRSKGIVFIPVEHEGNSQFSEEEAVVISEIVNELEGCWIADESGHRARPVTVDDILFVAPYNMQVQTLERVLPLGSKIGTVDRFQGQEAPIVLVSMCASQADEIPRGLEFLLSRQRVNVAISRAQSLAIVVGSPKLTRMNCTTIDQMKLVNFYCRLIDYSKSSS